MLVRLVVMETISSIVIKLLGEYKKKLNHVSECSTKPGRLPCNTNLVNRHCILALCGPTVHQMRSQNTYLGSAKNGDHTGINFVAWTLILQKSANFHRYFFLAKKMRYPDGNRLENILVVFTYIPSQITTMSSSQREKSQNLRSVPIVFTHTLGMYWPKDIQASPPGAPTTGPFSTIVEKILCQA